MTVTLTTASAYTQAGLSVIPIRPDGSKAPALPAWKKYQKQLPSAEELAAWFRAGNKGVAVIGGDVSGGLEVIDFESQEAYQSWRELVEAETSVLLSRLPVVRTPNGVHVYYRCPGHVAGNQKLARQVAGDGEIKTLIETRGEGGYVLAPGSPGCCHTTGRVYEHLAGPLVTETPTVTVDERDVMLTAGRSLNDHAEPATQWDKPSANGSGLRPGEVYEQRTTWADILEPAGWTQVRECGGMWCWRRPGKSIGWSATTGMRSNCGRDLLYVFSSNADPFQPEKSYSKFAAYTMLKHGGDYKAAAKALGHLGYGSPLPRQEARASDAEPPASASTVRERIAPFPIQCLPESLALFASEVASSLSCPVDLVAVPMLVLAGAAIGTTHALGVKRKWLECPRFYLAEVADPGAAKTPAINAVCQPFYRRQRELAKKWEVEIAAYEFAKETYDAAKKRLQSRNAPASAMPAHPGKRPPYPHLYTTDATTESLAPILSDNPRGVVLVRDEVSGLMLGMNQYKGGKGSDRQFWLSTWSGEPAKVDRKSNHEAGAVLVHHPFVNIMGGIQPDMLSVLCDEQMREDGFIHRFLFTYPPASFGTDWCTTDPSESSEKAWDGVVGRLLALRPHQEEDGLERPHVVKMTDQARAYWVSWYDQHAAEMRGPDFPYNLIGPWSKMRSYCARLALVLHFLRMACAENFGDEVDLDSMRHAATIADYFKSHAKRVYSRLSTTKEDETAGQVIQWIVKHGGETTVRQLQMARIIKKTSEGEALLNDLTDRGFGHVEVRKANNHKSVSVFVLAQR